MKKIFLTLVMALFAVGAFAQNDEVTGVRIPSGYQGFFEMGNTLLHFDKNISTTIQLSTTHGGYFNEHLFAGLGIAYEWNRNYEFVPIYANLRYVFMSHSVVSPIVSLRLGSYLGDDIGAYGDLAVGVRFASKRDFAVSVLVACTYYDKITRNYYEEWVDSQGVWHHENVERQINPSGIAVRVGIEW
jgi:hypothetical protein